MRKIVFTLIFLLIFSHSFAAADTLHLKNDAKLDGEVVKKMDSGVTFKTPEGTVFWHYSEIKGIDGAGSRFMPGEDIAQTEEEAEKKGFKIFISDFIK